MRDNRAEDVFLKYGGLLLKTGHKPQFAFMEQKMSPQEVFSFVTQHLQANERSEQVGKLHGDWEAKGPKKDRENNYAIRVATITPQAPPTPAVTSAPVATQAQAEPIPPTNPPPTPAPSAWTSGKGAKGKSESKQGYKGKGPDYGKGYNQGSTPSPPAAGRGGARLLH